MTDELPGGVEEYAQGLQRASNPFTQPKQSRSNRPAPVPMSKYGVEITARFKEIFYHYDSRRSADNRSAQLHLGPSEIGTPCDRRLALSLLRRVPVSLGGDGWAPFVGTHGHKGLSGMFLWSGGHNGRYLVDHTVKFPSKLMPYGSLDLYDRVTRAVWDFKFMGRWSLDKLRTKGPSDTYQVQIQTYGYGLSIEGEEVERVCIVGLPRESSSLDDMYVWDERYDPQVARDALARAERIKELIREGSDGHEFAIADDCRWCPFYKKGATSLESGCNGRR